MRTNPPMKTKTVEPQERPDSSGEVAPSVLRTPEQFADEKVMIGICAPESIKTRFFVSLAGLMRHEQYGTAESRLADIHLAQPGARIAHGRNLLVDIFLQSDCEWLAQLDYDLVFPPSLIDFWLSAADPVERPIAQALYFGYLDGELTPFAYKDSGDGIGYGPFLPREGTVTRCAAVAAGATVIHRTVFEKIQAEYEAEYKPYTWYGEYGTPDGRAMTEDVVFSKRAAALGFPMVVDTRVVLGHLKERIVGYEI